MTACLIELNEINFDVVKKYIEDGEKLPNFKLLIESKILTTRAEDDRENLEPWIQWVSVHTGLTAAEHGVFRLGDIVNYKGKQLFEEIESRGYSVGSVCAMNADNRLQNPAFFIPDPWTLTKPDNSFSSKAIARAISQAVNDNASGKLVFRSILDIGLAILKHIPLWSCPRLFWQMVQGRKNRWQRALFLDILLSSIFRSLVRKKKPDFATLFLNAGAHIQHHYMFASSVLPSQDYTNPAWYVPSGSDPVLDAYRKYDQLIGEFFSWKDCSFIIATGLSQKPFESPVYHYRLKNHSEFVAQLGLNFQSVEPRMSRDFLVTFLNNQDRDIMAEALKSLRIEGRAVFGHIDIREKSLFVMLDYPCQIVEQTMLDPNDYLPDDYLFTDAVVFVAISNGEHQSKGFLAIDPALEAANFTNGGHVAKLHDTILDLFPPKMSLDPR